MPAVTKNNSMAHTMSAVPCSSSESSDQPFSYRIGGVDLIDSPLLELGTKVLMSRGTRQPYFVRLPSSPASISMHPPALQTYFSNPGTLSRFYRCDFEGCGKDFKSPWHLQSHNKHHSHERNYNCVVPSCGAKFQRRPDLLRHCKSVHAKTEDRTIACVCGKSFGRLDSLRRHQNKICPSVTQSM
ncbi:hypothetical protein BC830DRAFT_1089518 [Chytriomyces sp. MP71]|nr:hypothetical protein BC830DRAFT_1089518 [Chytriomyces sp. MP71]